MKKLTKYEAEDGALFNSEEECVAHEKTEALVTMVAKFIDEYSNNQLLYADCRYIADALVRSFTITSKP